MIRELSQSQMQNTYYNPFPIIMYLTYNLHMHEIFAITSNYHA